MKGGCQICPARAAKNQPKKENKMKFVNDDFVKETVKKLVRIDSCQPFGNEKQVIDAILSYFPKDIHREIIDHGGFRQTLIIKIDGESERGGVAFVGHTDTVAYGDESRWTYPPLSAEEHGGFVYGRGTADMKSGDSAMIAAALEILLTGKKPKEPIYFCFTADEEVSGLGALALSKAKCLESVREYFVAEPTNEDIGVCEKGALWLKVKTTGLLSHGSRPEVGVNAVEKTVEFYERFEKTVDRSLKDKFLGNTTMAVTKLNGGVMTNVIPAYAEMEIDMRTLTNIDHDKVIKDAEALAEKMAAEKQGLHIEIEVINNRPAVSTDENHPFVERVADICRDNGFKVNKKGLFFYTDASQIIPAFNAPFVIMGPGDDLMAHQIDERVEISSMTRMAKVYFDYIMKHYM